MNESWAPVIRPAQSTLHFMEGGLELNTASAIPRRMAGGVRLLWIILIAIVVASFVDLLYYGGEIYWMAPPLPDAVETTDG